jgi:hypothetical protein
MQAQIGQVKEPTRAADRVFESREPGHGAPQGW